MPEEALDPQRPGRSSGHELSSFPGIPAQVAFTPMRWGTLTTSLPINQSPLLLALEQVCQREKSEVGIPVLLKGSPMEKT